MDSKRLFISIALSAVIVIVFQFIGERYLPHPAPKPAAHVSATAETNVAQGSASSAAGPSAQVAAVNSGPRLNFDAPRISGSIALTGAIFDDVILKDYRETVAKDSPLVQVMGRVGSPQPSYAQFGWSAAGGVKVPDDKTLWQATSGTLTPQTPVTLSWNNGQGQIFQLIVSVDDNYMFSVQQKVLNSGAEAVKLFPWSRVIRDYKPADENSMILFDGPEGVFNKTLKQISYKTVKSDGKNVPNGQAYSETSDGGWIGFTDKYWLTALVPDQAANLTGSMSYATVSDGDGSAYQTSFIATAPIVAAAGGDASQTTHLFAGAKVVHLLDAYQNQYNIPNFDKSVDFGHLYIITKPIFFALDWLNHLTGNFGLAILCFTVGVKLLFFPLANYSFRSMAKMKIVQPKIAAIRERLKDEPTKQQQEIMALYKTEKINPASGCLPMLVQIPVFFALYKVIFTTIEMRQTPFFGWIHDLSAPDPTNLFNLFGLIPFDPTVLSPFLHVGGLPIIMGITMFLQQRLNPAPPDPVQARMFQFMPIIFTFILARSPAGLVLYWAWNNLLTVGQQWLIMRQAKPQSRTGLVKSQS